MFLDDDLPKPKDAPQPRNLEKLSIEELREYKIWLREEEDRAEAEIKRKQSAGDAASMFFKP